MSIWILAGLILLGYLAIFIEFFIPAAGLIGASGAACVAAAVVLTYTHHSVLAGSLVLAGVLATAPVFLVMGFKLFPRSFVGKRLILSERQETDAGFTSFTRSDYAEISGSVGTVLTDLRPSGMARIGAGKYSVVTSGEYLAKGSKIKVVRVEGSRIVVRGHGKQGVI